MWLPADRNCRRTAEIAAETATLLVALFLARAATPAAAPPSAILATKPEGIKTASKPWLANIVIIKGIRALCIPVKTRSGKITANKNEGC